MIHHNSPPPARNGAACLALLVALLLPGRTTAATTEGHVHTAVTLHGGLKSSVPRDKARLDRIPRELRLTFTEAPELAVTRIKLRAPDKSEVALGELGAAGKDKATIVAPVTGRIAAGVYTVEWEMAGEDGHPIDGVFTFTVTQTAIPSAAAPPASVVVSSPAIPTAADTARRTDNMAHHDTISMPTSATRFDSESAGYVVVRFFLYAALLIVAGAAVFRNVVLSLVERRTGADPQFVTDAARRAATVGWMAACLLLAACVARLAAQSVALNGSDGMMDASRLRALMLGTKWGLSWMAQLVATLAALHGFNRARRVGSTVAAARVGWIIASVAALVLAFTPAFASHAAASQRLRPLAMLFDGLHIIAASGWMGSLFLVLAAGMPAALALRDDSRGTAIAHLINTFSPTALLSAAILVGTGLFATWLHLGSVAALWNSEYGSWLFRKLVALSIVAATGTYNWLRVKPTLGSLDAAARIRRSATLEVSIAVVVLILTAILVATPPPISPT